MAIKCVSRNGDEISLPIHLHGATKTIFNTLIEKQGKVVGSCYGHGICQGCQYKHKPEDSDKFIDVVDPGLNLPDNTKLACCSAVKSEPDDDIEIEFTRQRSFM